jgi:nitrite reductase/ring-hydroxylating ferredoxin subunit
MSQLGDLPLNRRDFVAAAAVAGVCGVCGLTASSALAQATTQPSSTPLLDVGPASDYTADGPTMTWADDHHVIVVRQSGKIFAMTSKCTHHGCVVTDTGSQFNCPCHNSDFQYDGELIDGPAKRALPRYGISVDTDGHIQVDVHKTFPQPKWDDPASFITVPAAAK